MIKLPKPVGRICKYVGPGNADAPKIITRSFDEFPVGLYPDFWKDKENLYTEKQLKKAVRDALQARLDSTESDYKGKCAELELVHDSHDAALAKLKELEDQKDGAYLERNRLVSLLSKVFPSGKKKTAIEGWSEDWHGCVYIDLPTGQASWHYHDSQAWLFDHLPEYQGTWDGHTTEEKYERIAGYDDFPVYEMLANEIRQLKEGL